MKAKARYLSQLVFGYAAFLLIAATAFGQSPTLSSMSPTAFLPGMQVTLTGSGFGATQGDGFVGLQYGGVGSVVSWSDTQIVFTVPAGTVGGPLRVNQNQTWSNSLNYTMVPSTLTSMSPTSVSPGTQVTLTGSGFGAAQGNGYVQMANEYPPIVSWSDTQIVVTVPTGTVGGQARVNQYQTWSNSLNYTMVPSTLTSMSPTSVSPGTQVTLTGSGFGAAQSNGYVQMANEYPPIVSWSDTQIVVTVPTGTVGGQARVNQYQTWSNTLNYAVVPPPSITSLSPSSGAIGSTVTITGSNLGAASSGNSVTFNGVTTTATSWSSSSIVVSVPQGATTGNVVVTLSGLSSNPLTFTVTGFSATGGLNSGRSGHRAVLLDDGRVLIVGGSDANSNALASAELYTPSNQVFTATGSLATARRNSTITLLDSGKVLIVGGLDNNLSVLSSAEICDPSTGAFTNIGQMATPRANHTATRLADGTVLIAGGLDGNGNALSSAELFIPSSGTFVPTGSLNVARGLATATTLNNGTILLAGGYAAGTPLSSAELYDPSTKSFSQLPNMNSFRVRHTATLLNTGQVLIAGGQDGSSNDLASAEVFDPTTATFTPTASMNKARGNHSATLLTNGQVLLIGGFACDPSNCGATAVNMSTSAELYDPATGQFSVTGSLGTARQSHTSTLLANGNVLVVGGWSGSNPALSSAELYQPAALSPGNLVSIAIAPQSPTLVAGSSQTLTATGTFSDNTTQTLASVIWSSSNSSVVSVTNDSGSNSGIGNDSSNSGTIFGIGQGSATISACSGAICGSTSTSVVTLSSISVSPSSPTIALDAAQEFQLTATGVYSDGSTADLTSSVTWSSSDSSILFVLSTQGNSGIVVPGAVGTANAIATAGSVSGSTPVNVVAAPAPPSPPTVANAVPSSGSAGTQVTVSGSGFGNAQGNGYVQIGTTLAAVVSWSDTQVVATVSLGSSSGTVQVQQSNLISNSIPFTVNTASISTVSPASGIAGTQVTITGSGFGDTQNNGLVWLGTAPAVVSSWSDAQVVATVTAGSLSGNAQVLQNGVLSNQVPFSVPGNPHINNIAPTSGPVGTAVTINGTGFGSSQGNSTVWIGGANATVTGWSDTQVQASVAGSALTGVAKLQENGIWSNASAFTVTGNNSGSNPPVTLVPDLISMVIGDTRSIDALDSNGQPVTGLTWSSSDPNVVALSSDDPPVMTALAAGNVTITAGDAVADVTVYSGALPVGTVQWSDAGDGSGVQSIVPAVPSPNGGSDVFSVQGDGNVRALTSDGKLLWTAFVGQNPLIFPDFNGGFLSPDFSSSPATVRHFEGRHGSPINVYTYSATGSFGYDNHFFDVNSFAVMSHTDGTTFLVDFHMFTGFDQTSGSETLDVDKDAVIGIDPSTNTQKFSVSIENSTLTETGIACTYPKQTEPALTGIPIIGGDGYYYLPYVYTDQTQVNCGNTDLITNHIETHSRLLRVGSDGSSTKIVIGDWTADQVQRIYIDGCDDIACTSVTTSGMVIKEPESLLGALITNADQGVVYTWELCGSKYLVYDPTACSVSHKNQISSINASGNVSTASMPLVPNQSGPPMPELQAPSGKFIGLQYSNDYSTYAMESFDIGGNVQWVQPNYFPQMATADGGLIGIGSAGQAAFFDANGNTTGQLASFPTYSWKGAYQSGSAESVVPAVDLAGLISSSTFGAVFGGNLTGNGVSMMQHTFRLFWCGTGYLEQGTCSGGSDVTFGYIASPTNDNIIHLQPLATNQIAMIASQALHSFSAAFSQDAITIGQASSPSVPPYLVNYAADAEFTAYVVGTWPTPAFGLDFPGAPSGRVYYLSSMDFAQIALGHPDPQSSAGWINFVPQQNSPDFSSYLTAIGTSIGNAAAHETAHYLAGVTILQGNGLAETDCGPGDDQVARATHCADDDNFVYNFFSASGFPQDPSDHTSRGGMFFYGIAGGDQGIPVQKTIHWSTANKCWLQNYAAPKSCKN